MDDLAVDLEQIADPALRRLIGRLLNRIEDVQTEIAALREENQRLRDENARLKGLSPRPSFPARSSSRPPTDHSSEQERHIPTPRQRRRKRDHLVSYGPRTTDGARAWDTFQTLAATAAKLDVSFYQYLCDRLSGTPHLPALADLIAERAATLNLGRSWTGQTPPRLLRRYPW